MAKFKKGDLVCWSDGAWRPLVEHGTVEDTRTVYPQVRVRYADGRSLWTPERDLAHA